MATAQVIFQRFYYSKSYVKYSIYVSDFSLQCSCIVRSYMYMVSDEWCSHSILPFPKLHPLSGSVNVLINTLMAPPIQIRIHVVVSSDETVSISWADPLSIERSTNSSLSLEVKYVASVVTSHSYAFLCGIWFSFKYRIFNLRRCSAFCSRYILQILTLVHQHTFLHHLCNTLPELKTRVLSWWKETLFLKSVSCVSVVSFCVMLSLLWSDAFSLN